MAQRRREPYSHTDAGPPNLDAMFPDDLRNFWFHHQRGRNYLELFPHGGKGTRGATADLANYAANKATAMECRQRGEIDRARMYEDIADRIYNGLPSWAKW